MRMFVLAICLMLSPCLFANVARATDDKAEASRLFTEGLALFEKKSFDGAREKFSASYGKFPSPNTLLNLARTEEMMDRCVDAIGHYRAYTDLPENPRITPQQRELAQGQIKECL